MVGENRGTRKKTTNLPVVTDKPLSNDSVYGLYVCLTPFLNQSGLIR